MNGPLSDALVTKIRKSDETDSGLFVITIKCQNNVNEVCDISAKNFNFIKIITSSQT